MDQRCSLLFVLAIILTVTSACGELPEEHSETPTGSSNESAIPFSSEVACRIDSDCASGTFCFRRSCVWECVDNADCTGDEVCSTRSRCIDATTSQESASSDIRVARRGQTSGSRDQSLDSGGIEVVQWPDLRIPVAAGATSIAVSVETDRPVPGGEILYTVRKADDFGTLQSHRAEGSRIFLLDIPVVSAGLAEGAEPEVVHLTTPFGERTIYLVPSTPRSGVYIGTFTSNTFGGSPIALEFAVETVPEDALTLAEAESANLLIRTKPDAVISLPLADTDSSWMRRPLEFEEDIDAWVATYAANIDTAAFFGSGLYPDANRSFRVEISTEEDETLRGAIADRWRGIFDRTSADGVSTAGIATISGTFDVSRNGRVPAPADVADMGLDLTAPFLRDRPKLDECGDTEFSNLLSELREDDAACLAVPTRAQFETASAVVQNQCAAAVASSTLDGETLSSRLIQWIDPDSDASEGSPSGDSFREFVAGCANGAGGLCVPTSEQRCARQLVAYAIDASDSTVTTSGSLSESYDALTREIFIGRQLVAFYLDTTTRLDWLQSGEAPPFLAPALRDYNESILREYREGVLDIHLASVFGQLDASGLAVLTRAQTDPNAIANRKTLLSDLLNSWRAAMDSLTVIATRWNVLYQNDTKRNEAAEFIRSNYSRMYVVAAILQSIARETGSSYMGGSFGAGFVTLERAVSDLSLPFNALLFARDAEVVTSQSVDPQSSNISLLGELSSDSLAAIRDAEASVSRALEEEQEATVNEEYLVGRYIDQVNGLRNELIELCGLPEGCTASDVGVVEGCQVRTDPGECGKSGGSNALDTANVSEAGKAFYQVREAALSIESAKAAREALAQDSRILGETANAFADKLEDWDQQRRGVSAEITRLFDEITALDTARISQQIATLRSQRQIREAAYGRQRDNLEKWNNISVSGNESDLDRLGTINALNSTSAALGFTAERTDTLADIMADGLPKHAGTSTDPSFAARFAIRFPAYIASTVASGVAVGLGRTAESLQIDLENQQAVRDAELSRLEGLSDLAATQTDNDIQALQDEFETYELRNEFERGSIDALIEAMERNLALDQAYEKDLQELRDRRDRWKLMLVDVLLLEYEVAQAEITARQRELAYYQVVQRAQLIEGRFRNMQERTRDITNLLGSPDVLFSSANRIALAESRLERARSQMNDWLTALEYFAVRPFVSQRLAIMLARNPGQLEAIANEIIRLQQACGGPSTLDTVDVSLRDDILGRGYATSSQDDPERIVTSSGRFQELLERAETPVSRLVAYSDDETIGERLDRGNMLAVNFDLSVESFANLALTCNAKVSSIAVQLVGDELLKTPGNAQPVVSVVYGGGGQMRSCQPNISEYVSQFGPDATAFGPVSAFRTPGRVVSPVAGISEFGPKSTWNATLEGLPFASDYTVLIDLDLLSNEEIDWSRLSDVRLQFRYTYQDVFPEGQCE